MRNADHVSGVGVRFVRRLQHLVAGERFEHVPDHLNARNVPALRGFDPFDEPADCRSERDAVIANLAFGFKRFQEREEFVTSDLVEVRVMNLVHVDAVGLQPAQ